MKPYLCILLSCFIWPAVLFAQAPAEPGPQPWVTEIHGEVYARHEGYPLHLNVFYPQDIQGPLPCVAFIPGSAWKKQNLEHHSPDLKRFAARGFVVACVEYRPTGIQTFPAQVEDAKTALRYLRYHAQRFHIDTANVFVWGTSSGGHTALFVGFTPEGIIDGAVADSLTTCSYKVNAIADFFGPTELSLMIDQESAIDMVSTESTPDRRIDVNVQVLKELARLASPLHYIRPSAPPVFIAHGTADPLVPFAQSTLLADSLAARAVPYEFHPLPDAVHGGPRFFSPALMDKMEAFFRRYLR